MSEWPLLTLLVAVPWAGGVLLAAQPRLGARAARALGLLFSLSTLGLGGAVLAAFDPATTALQLVEKRPWIAALGVHYHLGVDGMSLMLLLLTGIVAPLTLAGTVGTVARPALYAALLLFLQGSALGVFLAQDFFPWFVCWELSLVPAFFLIKLWGGPGADRAAYQFVVYTIGGSAFLLLGFAALYAATGTFDFVRLATLAREGSLAEALAGLGGVWPRVVFLGILLGLAVKVPLFPFHTWLPSAYAEAPTGASMFLTGILSKMGLYGFLRLLWPLFPDPLQAAAPALLWLAVGGVVFGAYAALRQRDLKRMVAYSSINHLSYCLLALFAVAGRPGGSEAAQAAALGGAILQMFNHGLSAAALFFCVGALEARTGRRGLDDFGGVRTAAPVFAALCGVALFSSLGLPGLNGFVGEFLIFRGVFGLTPAAAVAATAGLLATAMFLLTFWQRVFHGPAAGGGLGFRDLAAAEVGTLAPLAALMVLLGVLPHFLTRLFDPLVASWVARLPSP